MALALQQPVTQSELQRKRNVLVRFARSMAARNPIMPKIESPACPHCGSLRVVAVRTPHIISASSSAAPELQTHDHAWQCICGAVFTVSAELASRDDNPTAAGLSLTEELRRSKPR